MLVIDPVKANKIYKSISHKNIIMKIRPFKLVLLCFLFVSAITNAQVADTIFFQKYAINQKFIYVQIDGKNYKFLFDTGAGLTFISDELASSMKMKIEGVTTQFSKEGKRQEFKKGESLMLKIGKTFLLQKQVAIMNPIINSNTGLPKMDGIVSLKTFEGQIISIDLENNFLLIETNKSFSDKSKLMLPIASTFSDGINGNELNVFLNVSAKGKALSMKFETGNNDRVLLSKQSAKLLNLATDSILSTTDIVKTGDVGFVIHSAVAENLTTITKDLIYDGIFNYAFIAGYNFTLDLSKQKVFFTPY